MKRDRHIDIRVTEQEKAELRRGAQLTGFVTKGGKPDVSAYVRALGRQERDVCPDCEKELPGLDTEMSACPHCGAELAGAIAPQTP